MYEINIHENVVSWARIENNSFDNKFKKGKNKKKLFILNIIILGTLSVEFFSDPPIIYSLLVSVDSLGGKIARSAKP